MGRLPGSPQAGQLRPNGPRRPPVLRISEPWIDSPQADSDTCSMLLGRRDEDLEQRSARAPPRASPSWEEVPFCFEVFPGPRYAKTRLSAWTTPRRVHDARPLPCVFRLHRRRPGADARRSVALLAVTRVAGGRWRGGGQRCRYERHRKSGARPTARSGVVRWRG